MSHIQYAFYCHSPWLFTFEKSNALGNSFLDNEKDFIFSLTFSWMLTFKLRTQK